MAVTSSPVAGYMKMPPYLRVLWTSATIEPIYLENRIRIRQ